MSKYTFQSFEIKRYRSLVSLKLGISNSEPVVICGENNIGKTNYLRALNLFFNHIYDSSLFTVKEDIPNHIYHGSRGAGFNTELIGEFVKEDDKKTIKVTFKGDGKIDYKINNKKVDFNDVNKILKDFKFFFVESNNIDLPQLMSEVLEKDGLLKLDKKRTMQSRPLEKLQEFIDLSKEAISDIEKEINKCFEKLTDFDGILKGKKIKINFAEYEKLRDVIKNMTSITLYDGNNNGIASKGSGAQRAVFISLMQYIAKNTKKSVVWGIDEPEVFLQPRLQKKLFSVIKDIVSTKRQPVILTTHSQNFISLSDLSSTHIFQGKIEEKEYARKPGQKFYETNTSNLVVKSDFEKSVKIKEHLGINNNDGWEILPYNLVVEGEEDKKYLEALFSILGKPAPNIIWSGGASKIAGYLQYYNIFAKDLDYKPEFVCVFDNDDEGRNQRNRIKPSKYNYIHVSTNILVRHDGKEFEKRGNADWEIEDFLPQDVLLEQINKILKKNKYRIIKKQQVLDRMQPGHINTQILNYAEQICIHNNKEKESLMIDNDGRKKEICKMFCEYALSGHEIKLNKKQRNFLISLLK